MKIGSSIVLVSLLLVAASALKESPLGATGAEAEAFGELKDTRKTVKTSVNGALESAVKAAVSATKLKGANFSDHLDQANDDTNVAASAVATLKAKRAEVTRIREEARKAELAKLGASNSTVKTHQLSTASATGVAAPAPVAPKVIYKGPPTDLLEKLINATNTQVAQDNQYQKAQLALQKKRMEAMGVKTDDDDAAAADDSPDGRKMEKSKMDHLLLAPGRAQARSHCGVGVMKTAGYRWCEAKKVCLDSHAQTCPGDEWTKPMKSEVELLTQQLGQLRRQQLMKDLTALKGQVNSVKKVMGLPVKDSPPAPQVRPAGVGEFGRLKGHAYSLRRQIKRLSKSLKVPVPEDPFLAKNLPVPVNDNGTPGAQQGHAGELMKKLASLVNQIATTKNRIIIAELNKEVDRLTGSLRTMTIGSHCLACGKGHCAVKPRDAANLWPKPRRCGCNDLAHPGCPCPKNCGDAFKPKKSKAPKCGCVPTCPCTHPPALCGDPGTPRHAVRLGQTYSENSTLHFLCQPPFVLKGSEFRTCQGGRQDKWKQGDGAGGWKNRGTWSGKQPSCHPPSCGKPDDLEHGDWIGMKFEFPHRMEARCHRTFSLDGAKVIQCMANGKWDTDPQTVLCVPLQDSSDTLKASFDTAQKDEAQAGDATVDGGMKARLQGMNDQPVVNSGEEKLQKKNQEAHAALRGVTIDELLMPGTTKIDIDHPEAKGFRVGMTVLVGADSENVERRVVKDMQGDVQLDAPLKKDHDAGEILRAIKHNSTDKTRAMSDAVKGMNDNKLDSAANYMSRKNNDIEVGSMKDMERAVLDSQRALENSRAARDEAAAMVLANSPSSGIPAELRDPLLKTTEGKNMNDHDRATKTREALAASPLSRPQAVLEEDQKHEMAGRAGQSAGEAAAGDYATKIFDMKKVAQPERADILKKAKAIGKDSGYAAGAKQFSEDEGARVGRNAAIAAVAHMLADQMQVSVEGLLKGANADILAITRESMSGEAMAKEETAKSAAKDALDSAKEKTHAEFEEKKEEAVKEAEENAEAEALMSPEEKKAKQEAEKKAKEAVAKLEKEQKSQEDKIDQAAGAVGAGASATGASGSKDIVTEGSGMGRNKPGNSEESEDNKPTEEDSSGSDDQGEGSDAGSDEGEGSDESAGSDEQGDGSDDTSSDDNQSAPEGEEQN